MHHDQQLLHQRLVHQQYPISRVSSPSNRCLHTHHEHAALQHRRRRRHRIPHPYRHGAIFPSFGPKRLYLARLLTISSGQLQLQDNLHAGVLRQEVWTGLFALLVSIYRDNCF